MRLTNETGLPDTIVKVAERLVNSHPDMGGNRYSVTELLKSVRQIVLGRIHADEIQMDVQDTFSMWNGTAIHAMLEEASKGIDRFEGEQRLEAEIDGVVISGAYDLYDRETETIYDYKTSKIASIEAERKLDETKWLEQLYRYRRLRKLNGLSVPVRGVIIAMATDFSKMKAETVAGYPEHPIQMLEWTLDDEGFEERSIQSAVSKAKEAIALIENGNEPPLCTYSDCWCTEDYAVKKHGAKRADKVFRTADEAFRYFFEEKRLDRNQYSVYHRISEFSNCRNYCQCAPFCSQWDKNKDHTEVCEDITEQYVPF